MKKIKLAMLRRFFKILAAIFCGGVTTAQGQPNPPVNVLFIGNSFTLMNSMPVMVQKLATSKNINANVVMSAKGNHTFKMHSERADMYTDIKKATWDYVVLQGFSRELSYGNEHIDTAVIPYFQKIVDTLRQNNPCVKILLYMTWGYENGYSYMNEIGTYEEMSASIESGYRYLAEKYDFPIVPVGNVWMQVRKQHPDYGLYQPDEFHPTKIGSYIVASSFFSAIFQTSPVGGYTTGIADKVALSIQKIAYDYIKGHFEEYKLDRNVYNINAAFTKDGKFSLTGKANFPNARSVKWDLGDGTLLESTEINHNYKSYGDYLVKLTVEDTCGTRDYIKEISFSKPYQPSAPQSSKPKTKDTSITKKI
jgi:hypothetical protein